MNHKGQTTVEFALTVVVLLAFLFALVDFAVMFYVNLTMQHAVREGARYAITGQGGQNGNLRRSALIDKIKESSNGLYEKNANPLKSPTVSVVAPASTAPFDNYTGSPVDDTGKPGEIIMVSLAYSWPLLTPVLRGVFPDGRYDFVVRATMRNEPWEGYR
jgi:hypothetical protein